MSPVLPFGPGQAGSFSGDFNATLEGFPKIQE
jgi:hypothetical protein